MILSIVSGVGSGLLGAMMLFSGIDKLRRHDDFLGTLAAYRLLPDWGVEGAAWALGVLETAIGAAMLLHVAPSTASIMSTGLFGLFAAAMIVNLMRGRTELSCGCLPGLEHARLSWGSVARAVEFAGLSWLAGMPGTLVGAVRLEAVASGVCLFVLGMTATLLFTPAPSEAV